MWLIPRIPVRWCEILMLQINVTGCTAHLTHLPVDTIHLVRISKDIMAPIWNGLSILWWFLYIYTQIPIALSYLSQVSIRIRNSPSINLSVVKRTLRAQKNRYCIAGHLEMHWSYKDSSRQLQLNFMLFIIDLRIIMYYH